MICVCAQIRKDGHMEENAQKFLEKMNELVALGKKKKSILDVQEINDFFADMELSAEQMEKVFEYLDFPNSLFSAKTSLLANRFIMVDLPTLV